MALKSVSEEAKELGVSRGTLYTLARRKLIPHVKIGDRVLLDHEKVVAALEIQAENDTPAVRTLLVAGKARSGATHSK